MSGEILFVHSRLTMGGAERLRLSLLRELYRRGIPSRVCLLQEDGAEQFLVNLLYVLREVLGTEVEFDDDDDDDPDEAPDDGEPEEETDSTLF